MPTVSITGLSAKSNFGSLRIFSSDWHAFYFEQQNVLDGYGSATKLIDDGISLISSFEQVNATAIDAINVKISVNGLSINSEIGDIVAKIENPEIWSTGKIQRYPANAFKNSKVKLLGIEAIFAQNAIVAVGTSEINATIMLDNVVSFTQIANINADGVLSINDEELILLMAA